jgi:hypothetical protein
VALVYQQQAVIQVLTLYLVLSLQPAAALAEEIAVHPTAGVLVVLVEAVNGRTALVAQEIRLQHHPHKAITVAQVRQRVGPGRPVMVVAVVAEQGLLVLLALVLLAATGVMALHHQLQALL